MALRKLELMHHMFGADPAHTCGECFNMVCGRYGNRTLRKCAVYGLTHSEASDWAKSWVACGRFNQTYAGGPIIRLVRSGGGHEASDDEPLENQISLWEEQICQTQE